MHVTGVGCDALFNTSDALNWVPVQTWEALVQQRHGQKHVWNDRHKFVSKISEQANGRKTEPVVLVRLSVHRNVLKIFRMLVLCYGQFLNGSKIRPIVPITLGVISIISVVGFICCQVISPIGVIVITPAFFGLDNFWFFLGLWGARRCWLSHICLWKSLLIWFSCVFPLCSWPLPFPFHVGIPLKESFPFIPFLPFLPFPFPQKAVSCWSLSHAA